MDYVKKILGAAGELSSSLAAARRKEGLGEQSIPMGALWALHTEAWGKGGEPVSVLALAHADTIDNGQLELARNFVRRLKALRHPHVLAYLSHEDGFAADGLSLSRKSATIRIVVERVGAPNLSAIRSNAAWSRWFADGLRDAVGFLTTHCGLVHGNIGPAAVLVAPDGSPRLAGFEACAEHADSSRIVELAERVLPDFGFVPDADALRRLLNQIEGPVGSSGKTPSIDELCGLLMSLPVRTAGERDVVYRRLQVDLPQLPRPFIEHRLVPAALDFASGGAGGLPSDLVRLLIDSHSQKAWMRLVECPESGVRLQLLEAVSRPTCPLDSVFSSSESSGVSGRDRTLGLLLGSLHDSEPALRDAALRAAAALFLSLSERLAGECVRSFLRLAERDDQASLRANAWVCAGRVGPARLTASASLRRELVGALCRGLADAFGQCRRLALGVCAACIDALEVADVFQRLVPAISPLVLDKQHDPAIPPMALQLLKACTACGSPKALGLQDAGTDEAAKPKVKLPGGLPGIEAAAAKLALSDSEPLLKPSQQKQPPMLQAKHVAPSGQSLPASAHAPPAYSPPAPPANSSAAPSSRLKLGVARKLT